MSEILSVRHDIKLVYIQGSGLDKPKKVNYEIPNEKQLQVANVATNENKKLNRKKKDQRW